MPVAALGMFSRRVHTDRIRVGANILRRVARWLPKDRVRGK